MENGRALFVTLVIFLVVLVGVLLGRKFLSDKKYNSSNSLQPSDQRVPVTLGG